MAMLDRMTELATDPANFEAIGTLFAGVNARLFSFVQDNWGKRKVNRVAGGMVTFGTTPPPIKLYEEPTGRRALKGRSCEHGEGMGEKLIPNPDFSGGEGDSFGKVNRADRIRTCDLLVPKHSSEQASDWR